MASTPLCFLIDDDPDDQEIFFLAWQHVDPAVKCVYANDGIYGLEKLRKEPPLQPELIFIDLNMPRMNGVECLKEIKKLNHLRNVPVYMYSTAADPAVISECKFLGAKDFIKKSPAITDLENTFFAILTNHKSSKAHDGSE
jgi:CheY-like chemotaxis protein